MLRKIVLLLLLLPTLVFAGDCAEILNYDMKKLRSADSVNFCEAYQGKVILAVNTASTCGFTPQFKGLEALYQKYKEQGLVVLGFPSADFFQEYDDAEKTAEVCYINYGVTFPMFEKSAVRGAAANAFFKQLAEKSSTSPKWNFYKYLLSADGSTVQSFSNFTTPEELDGEIAKLLKAAHSQPSN